MTPLEFGDVVLVHFPYTDQSGSKRRPAVVISSHAFSVFRPDVILLAVTGRVASQPSPFDLRLVDWAEAGLAKASTVKPVALTVEQSLLQGELGRLSARDRTALGGLVQRLFSPNQT